MPTSNEHAIHEVCLCVVRPAANERARVALKLCEVVLDDLCAAARRDARLMMTTVTRSVVEQRRADGIAFRAKDARVAEYGRVVCVDREPGRIVFVTARTRRKFVGWMLEPHPVQSGAC